MAAEGQPPATLLQLALSQLTFFRALGLAVAFFCLSFVADCLSMPAYPASIARVSRAGKVTASGGLRSVIASLWNFTQLPWRFRDWILEGYAKVSQHVNGVIAPL